MYLINNGEMMKINFGLTEELLSVKKMARKLVDKNYSLYSRVGSQ